MASELQNLSNDLAAAVERASAGIVAVHARPRINSSGIVWRKNLILTSSEGVRFEEGIKVVLADGKIAEARLRGSDPGTDLALLEADTGAAAPMEFHDEANLKAGHLVLAVGRTASTGPIASFGVISGVSGAWKSWRNGKLDPFVRLDVSVYPTSSGGAAVDASGTLIGLVSTGLSRTSVLAVTKRTVERVAQKLLEHGYVGRGFLGIALQPVALPGDLKEKLKLDQETAVMLLGVEPNGPAASAGLLMGDILLHAGNSVITDADTLANALDAANVGQTVGFKVLRAGAVQDIQVRIGERPRKGK
ncbi:MAG TPA: trypsin-like peptidase domain-containing protein [Bryobacteraceae bacterium]|nr:trypsin-like peptidase domain-containing protein [Bryobacteraceae bacterium]